ncbi:TIGR03619 family F420-dependent LLM class oxidoreductase [Actinomycetota bacterium]
MRIGAKLPVFGPIVHDIPLGDAARRAEEAGFDSVWVSDHVVMMHRTDSRYPYSDDGTITWDATEPRLDAIVAMSTACAVTSRVQVGVAILLATLRNPLILAKQLASLDTISNGRVVVGAGAGWLAEEFKAVGVAFEGRGQRLDEWIDILRDVWTGSPEAYRYEHFEMQPGLLSYPTPINEMPILIGGMSKAAIRRAGRRGQGWLAFQRAAHLDLPALEDGLALMRGEAERAGRHVPQTVVRLTGSLEDAAAVVPDLAAIGVTEVIVEVDWSSTDGPERTLGLMRSGAS